jgi:hypothetical protein
MRPCFAPGVEDHVWKGTLQTTEPLPLSPNRESNVEPRTNMFEMLDLEEPSDLPAQPNQSTAKASKKNIPSPKNYEVESSLIEDLLFTIYCLFNDVNSIVEHVRTRSGRTIISLSHGSTWKASLNCRVLSAFSSGELHHS